MNCWVISINSDQAIKKLLTLDFRTVLDVGSGGVHASIFKDNNKFVTTINLYDADIVGDYCYMQAKGKYDCIWASHVLEHQLNPNIFLKKCFNDLNDNGILAITVPPLKHDIVGGHVTLWNAGILLYQLVMGGFDCSEASVKTYGYNISIIVRRKAFFMPKLTMDSGDLVKLDQYFPIPVGQDMFNGQIEEINW